MEGGWTWIWFQGKPSLSLIPGELWNINCKVCPASRQGSRALETLRLPTPFRATPPTLQRISRDLDGTPTASATGPHINLHGMTQLSMQRCVFTRGHHQVLKLPLGEPSWAQEVRVNATCKGHCLLQL